MDGSYWMAQYVVVGLECKGSQALGRFKKGALTLFSSPFIVLASKSRGMCKANLGGCTMEARAIGP